jgi:DNA-binding response OmpR family regulator
VLTAYGDTENEIEARRLGADDFLQKPAPLHVLAKRLAGILN